MPTFGELKNTADDSSLVRRATEGVAFLAPMSATIPDSILDTDNLTLKALPAAWWPIGIVGPGGFVFGSEVEKSEVEGWGYAVPVRTDITKAPKTIQFTPLERYKRQLQELTLGMDLSTVTPSSLGEVVYDEPDLPEPGEYRGFVLFKDGTTAAPFFRAKAFTKVKLAETGEETWNADEDSVGQEVTLDVLQGPEGFPVRHFMGGKAFDPAKYGFTAA